MPEETIAQQPVSLPRLNEPAPAFEAVTTHGTIRLSDYGGSWLILFSHPADFTPVCTTEFIAFAEIYPELQTRGVELLGLSIDSVYSHIAWMRNIEEKTGVQIPFPVIADLNKEVASLYGMVMPGESKSETVRCVFIIDPKSVVRAMIYYPDEPRSEHAGDPPHHRRPANRRQAPDRHAGELETRRQGDRAGAQDDRRGAGAHEVRVRDNGLVSGEKEGGRVTQWHA